MAWNGMEWHDPNERPVIEREKEITASGED